MLKLFQRHKHLGSILIVSFILITIFSTFSVLISDMVNPPTQVWLGDGIFNAQLATNENSREKGLSGKSELKENEALLMIYPNDDKWGIWMKDMKVPIDIVWLDSNKRVVYRVKNAQPDLGSSKTYQPKKPARYVIELPAGTIDAKRINHNSLAIFSINTDEKIE